MLQQLGKPAGAVTVWCCGRVLCACRWECDLAGLGAVVCVGRTERLRGALACYGIQNLCIAISAAAAAALVLLDMAETGTLQARQPVSSAAIQFSACATASAAACARASANVPDAQVLAKSTVWLAATRCRLHLQAYTRKDTCGDRERYAWCIHTSLG